MDLPTYVQSESQENYNEELNQTLRDNLSDNGWQVPTLSTANILAIAPSMLIGTIWFNTNLNKLQVKVGNPAVIETVTSA